MCITHSGHTDTFKYSSILTLHIKIYTLALWLSGSHKMDVCILYIISDGNLLAHKRYVANISSHRFYLIFSFSISSFILFYFIFLICFVLQFLHVVGRYFVPIITLNFIMTTVHVCRLLISLSYEQTWPFIASCIAKAHLFIYIEN